jgi:hypothetical protein
MANSLQQTPGAIFPPISNRVCSLTDKEIRFSAAISLSLTALHNLKKLPN